MKLDTENLAIRQGDVAVCMSPPYRGEISLVDRMKGDTVTLLSPGKYKGHSLRCIREHYAKLTVWCKK